VFHGQETKSGGADVPSQHTNITNENKNVTFSSSVNGRETLSPFTRTKGEAKPDSTNVTIASSRLCDSISIADKTIVIKLDVAVH